MEGAGYHIPGQRYVFEESTNLIEWEPLATNQVSPDGVLALTITNCAPRHGIFYRWRLVQ